MIIQSFSLNIYAPIYSNPFLSSINSQIMHLYSHGSHSHYSILIIAVISYITYNSSSLIHLILLYFIELSYEFVLHHLNISFHALLSNVDHFVSTAITFIVILTQLIVVFY